MATLLIPADAEQAVIDEFPAIALGTSIPDTKPELFGRVLRVGGTQRNRVQDTVILTLEAFHKRETAASAAINLWIAQLMAAVDRNRIGNETASTITVASLPQNFPLPSVPTHKRYIATLAIDFRRRVITT